jgi:hypothetical protein
MIGLIIVLIAYFIAATGFFGGDVIYALDVLENWYYFIATIIGIIAVLVMIGFTGGGAALGSSATNGNALAGLGGALAGYTTGGILAVLMMAKIAVQIWLVTWLMGSVDPVAVDFDALTTKQMLAMVVLLVLAFIGGSSSSSSKAK